MASADDGKIPQHGTWRPLVCTESVPGEHREVALDLFAGDADVSEAEAIVRRSQWLL